MKTNGLIGAWISVNHKLPEPGNPVLVVCDGKVLRAAHAPKLTLDEENWGCFNGGEGGDYDEESGTYYWSEGWYEWNEYEEAHWALACEPTYWMPLPEIPEELI